MTWDTFAILIAWSFYISHRTKEVQKVLNAKATAKNHQSIWQLSVQKGKFGLSSPECTRNLYIFCSDTGIYNSLTPSDNRNHNSAFNYLLPLMSFSLVFPEQRRRKTGVQLHVAHNPIQQAAEPTESQPTRKTRSLLSDQQTDLSHPLPA